MRNVVSGAVLLVLFAAAPALTIFAQEKKPEAPSASKGKPPAKPAVVTIVGCVQGTGAIGDPITLQNAQEGLAYRLTGPNMRAFVGKRVQIAGAPDSRRLRIVGGLVPSANVAGQAGAMDPSRAVVESTPLATSGKADPQLPEFRVRSVRTVAGACEQ